MQHTDLIRHALASCEAYLVNTRKEDDANVIVGNHDRLLRDVRVALGAIDKPYSTVAEFAKQVGGTNWVIGRRTKHIRARYGDDVITLSPKAYEAAERRAIEARY